ncbi:unnamed protein product [Calicophoron daubneyi]|uniref:Protein kinase domain-containing protein n=1 Tax=Calicophoron daubneyi TaxID=300641 RepID=A0AAV2TTM0_CALDB
MIGRTVPRMRDSLGYRRRSKSNHRCCYNSRFRNERTQQVSPSTPSSSSSSASGGKRKRSYSSGKYSSGYGCSDAKQPVLQLDDERRRRSSHVSHPKSTRAAETYKRVRITGEQAGSRDHRTDSSDRSCHSGIHRSRVVKHSNINHTIVTNRRPSRNGYPSRGESPNSLLRNGHIASPKRLERVGTRRERREQKRRDEKARRKMSHEGHKRKPSPIVSVDEVIKRRFRVQKILGEGSYGQVFQCLDLFTNSLTAVKALKPLDDYMDIARHELNVIESIHRMDSKRRSNCITSVDFFNWREHFFIVFPLLGLSVFNFLEQNNFEPYPVEQAAAITRQICEGVDFMHRMGLVHTDLKPENVLFVDDSYDEVYSKSRGKMIRRIRNPAVKIIDFGSAICADERHPTTIQTRHYRAPEVVMELGWDQSADVWSVGCMVFELVTGQCMFMTHDNLEHMAMMERVLGPIPKSLIRASPRRRYFRRGRLDWSIDSSDGRHVRRVLKPLGDYWFSYPDLYIRLAFDLTKEMLLYIPSERITCAKALEHPFLLSFQS